MIHYQNNPKTNIFLDTTYFIYRENASVHFFCAFHWNSIASACIYWEYILWKLWKSTQWMHFAPWIFILKERNEIFVWNFIENSCFWSKMCESFFIHLMNQNDSFWINDSNHEVGIRITQTPSKSWFFIRIRIKWFDPALLFWMQY